MKWKDHLRHLVYKNADQHGLVGSFEWREVDGMLVAAPVNQEVFGGKMDGTKVWTGFSFDLTAFGKEPGITIIQAVVKTYCIQCCPYPVLLVRGLLHSRRFKLAIQLEPTAGDAAEIIDTTNNIIRPLHPEDQQ